MNLPADVAWFMIKVLTNGLLKDKDYEVLVCEFLDSFKGMGFEFMGSIIGFMGMGLWNECM